MADRLWSVDLIEARSGSVVRGCDVLKEKIVAVVLAPHWLPMPLRQTLASFSEEFDQLKEEKKPLAFVYVAVDRDEALIAIIDSSQPDIVDKRPDAECFDDLRRQFPEDWFAVPFEDAETRSLLVDLLKSGTFNIAFVGQDGEILTKDGMEALMNWGAEGFPFSSQRIEELQKEADARVLSQTLKSLLVTEDRDYVVSNDDTKVTVEALEGKTVGLYFSAHWCGPCRRFTPVLADFYSQLKAKNEDFEVVFISADKDEASFEEYFKEMPWLAVPFLDTKTRNALDKHFKVGGIPTLVILDSNGKNLQTEGVELIFKHGIDVFPFTPERMQELKAAEEAKRAAQTLESLLVTETRNYVISKGSEKVEISKLKGKTVGLYFSAHWCPPCRTFTPKLASVYKKLKDKNADFEVIFISSDHDEKSFQEYYETMPWLALPFSDRQAKSALSSYFEVQGIPSLVILGPEGRTVCEDGRGVVGKFGARAYPFTDEHIRSVEAKLSIEAENLPKEIKHPSHPEHTLVLVKDVYPGLVYGCDVCDENGSGWVYHCNVCSYDVHPYCAQPAPEEEEDAPAAAAHGKEGWVCEGDVCRKV